MVQMIQRHSPPKLLLMNSSMLLCFSTSVGSCFSAWMPAFKIFTCAFYMQGTILGIKDTVRAKETPHLLLSQSL